MIHSKRIFFFILALVLSYKESFSYLSNINFLNEVCVKTLIDITTSSVSRFDENRLPAR